MNMSRTRKVVMRLLAAGCLSGGPINAASTQAEAAANASDAPANARVARLGQGASGRELEVKQGRLEDNLALLGQFKKPPEAMFRLYAAAYRVLSAKADATFMDVAEDPEVKRICRESGITHLGGPMLGSVEADGVAVWVRTLQPAKVEVRIELNGIEKTFGPVRSSPQTDLSAIVPVTGLAPSTRYPYRVLIDGKPIGLPDGWLCHNFAKVVAETNFADGHRMDDSHFDVSPVLSYSGT